MALMEMLVDPILSQWVPKWVVDQYCRRNPCFSGALEEVLQRNPDMVLNNRQVLFATKAKMIRSASRAKLLEQQGQEISALPGEGSGSANNVASRGEGASDGRQDDDELVQQELTTAVMTGDDLPVLGGGDVEASGGRDGEQLLTLEQQLSAAGPAPAASDAYPTRQVLSDAFGAAANPPGFDWEEVAFVSWRHGDCLRKLFQEYRGAQVAGREGDGAVRQDLDAWQGFARDVVARKEEER
jgi:hypothetical protein